MYREGIRDSKTRRQNPLLHAGVSSKGRDSDFDRKTKRRKIPTDALPSSPSADAQQPQESEDTGTGEDGPPASSDDLFYLDDGTKDGSRVTDKNRKLKIAYTVLAALSRRTTKTLEKELEPAAARRTLDWVLGFFPSLQIRYQHGGENGDVFDPKARSAEDFGIYLHEQIKHFRGTKLYNLNRTRPSFINATFLSGGSIHEEKTADANATVLPEVLVDRLEKSGSRVTGKTILLLLKQISNAAERLQLGSTYLLADPEATLADSGEFLLVVPDQLISNRVTMLMDRVALVTTGEPKLFSKFLESKVNGVRLGTVAHFLVSKANIHGHRLVGSGVLPLNSTSLAAFGSDVFSLYREIIYQSQQCKKTVHFTRCRHHGIIFHLPI
jgi:hypothetical protein